MQARFGEYRQCHIFFGFISVILIALFMCEEHPAISFCDIEDFAEVVIDLLPPVATAFERHCNEAGARR